MHRCYVYLPYDFDAPIALIHDSVLCRATDMSALSAIVREVYMHIFSENFILESWAQQIGAELPLPDGLIIGDLKPDSVIELHLFFLLNGTQQFCH